MFLIKYADDTTLSMKYKKINNLIFEANKSVQEINAWFVTNNLKLNATKTNLIGFSTNNVSKKICDKEVICENEILEFTEHTKVNF